MYHFTQKISAAFFQRSFRNVAGLVLFSVAVSGCQMQGEKEDTADLIFKNAKIYTVDATKPWATAIAVRDGKIIAVGEDADVEKWSGKDTRTVDVAGKLILPSFGDAHIHPVYGGLSHSQCPMYAGETIEGYLDIVKACVADTEGEGWVYGVGWRPGLFPPDGVPRKELLDAIEPNRPLVFRSTGGHSLWVNSKALEMANITKDTPDPVNGRIDRDPKTGELLGGLQETAKDLIFSLLPAPTLKTLQGAQTYTVNHLKSLGITSFLDAGVPVKSDGISPDIEAYRGLIAEGKLQAHVGISVKWDNEVGMEQLPLLLKAARSVRGTNFSSRSVKIYVDGVLAQRTAALLEPYSDAPDTKGEATLSAERLNEIVTAFDAEGFQTFIHAIGDKAIRMSLDAIEVAREKNGVTDNRHQITHAELITPEDALRFAELDVVANFQPLWSVMDAYMKMSAVRVGPERMKIVYPANSIIKAGAKIAYGADWPVASANPLEGIEVALTRRAPGQPNTEPLLPSEAITLEQAIEAYTLGVAYVKFNEDTTGSLSVGKNADLIILDQDIFTISKYDIAKTKVLLTLFTGKAIYGTLEGL